MAGINVRRWLCRLLRRGKLLYWLCNCRRYEPSPLVPVDPDPEPEPIPGPEPEPEPTPDPKPEPVRRDDRIICSCYNLIRARGDRLGFLSRIRELGAGRTRVFLEETWGGPWEASLQPFPVVGWWSPKLYGRRAPVFDLSRWNDRWWETLVWLASHSAKIDQAWDVVLFDHCSRKEDGWAKLLNPFYSSVQRYPDFERATSKDALEDARIAGGVMGDGLWTYHWRFAAQVLKTLNKIGLDYTVETANEYDWWNWADDEGAPNHEPGRPTGLGWHRRLVDHLIGAGVPRSRIVASPSRRVEDIATTVGRISRHGISTAAEIPETAPVPWSRMILSGDGGYRGHGNADYKGRRCASAAELAEIARMIKRLGCAWEYFDFTIEGPAARSDVTSSGVWANVDLFDPAPLAAMMAELRG